MQLDIQRTIARSDYDLLPYSNYAYPRTHISHLRLLGRLFGMNPPDHRRCRVLELGGGRGGNLIPMAVQFPKSEFVCVDLSPVQTREGRSHASALGLTNIRFEQRSILDFDSTNGQFDYIICHGVFSWVPGAVQDKILGITRDHLAENGLALVSYNTLPGWNTVQSIRDMIMYHCRGLGDMASKLREARALLAFVEQALGETGGPWAELIRSQIALIARASDSYLAHEHLEQDNEPFYLFQFLERVGRAGVKYLCDAEIRNMYLGHRSASVAGALARLGDVSRTEQYLDFIENRQFRHSVLCGAHVSVRRTIDVGLVEQLFVRSLLRSDPSQSQHKSGQSFTTSDGLKCSTADAAVGSALAVLAEIEIEKDVKTLAAEISARHPEIVQDQAVSMLRELAMHLFLAGGVRLSIDPPSHTTTVSEKPTALPLARYQATVQTHATNTRHETIILGVLDRLIIQQLDGTRDRSGVLRQLLDRVSNRDVEVAIGGIALTEQPRLGQHLKEYYDRALKLFASHALLVA